MTMASTHRFPGRSRPQRRTKSRRYLSASLAAACLLFATPAAAVSASDDFQALLTDHYAWLLRINPVSATGLGVHDYDAQLGDVSLAAMDREAAEAQAFLVRLRAISESNLAPADRVSYDIVSRSLAQTVEANGFGQRVMLFNTYSGWHQAFAGLSRSIAFHTPADYENYLRRLEQYPRLNDAALAVTEQAVRGGFVLPCSVLGNVERSITDVITAQPEQSRFYEPFAGDRPAALNELAWGQLQREARRVITDVVNPAYHKHAQFYRTRYAPHCAKSDGVSAQPGGQAYYAFRIRQETTTDLTADQIHAIGLRELGRIHADMDEVAKQAGFASRDDYFRELRSNPVYFAKTPEELMSATARVAKQIDGNMPKYFGRLPRLSYGLREVPREIAEGTTTAFYGPGAPETGIAGMYYVNVSKLDQRPLWEIPALSLHEAVPGHHHQIALQQELEIPAFRRNFTFFTAFVEGWGLYAESLGSEMGLYDTPAKKMGQLSYQSWRAARLVVDTGLHAKGWDKARAVAFMRKNTGLSDANIDAEVNRYISWPGQALAYKLGEIRIRELRARAESELGAKFDLRAFHDAVLAQGPVPLDTLAKQIDTWIAERK